MWPFDGIFGKRSIDQPADESAKVVSEKESTLEIAKSEVTDAPDQSLSELVRNASLPEDAELGTQSARVNPASVSASVIAETNQPEARPAAAELAGGNAPTTYTEPATPISAPAPATPHPQSQVTSIASPDSPTVNASPAATQAANVAHAAADPKSNSLPAQATADVTTPVSPATTQPPEPATATPATVRAEAEGAKLESPPPTPPRPAWKEIDPPDFATDPDRAEHKVGGLKSGENDWNLIWASVRGKLHAHRGLWREDSFACDYVGSWTIIVVSDGAGSARLSRAASRVACERALGKMKRSLSRFSLSPPIDSGKPTADDESDLRDMLVNAANEAQASIIAEAQQRPCSLGDLSATFLLMVYSPFGESGLVGALQVGDGAIGVYTADDSCTLIGGADHGEFSSETRFLTTAHIEKEFAQRVKFALFKKRILGVAVMSDGVADDFFPEDKRLIELFTGNPVRELKTKSGEPVYGVCRHALKNPRDGQALLDWIQYEQKGSSDDRTLVIMYRRGLA